MRGDPAGAALGVALAGLDAPGATIVGLGAHADDLEIGAGGTFLRLLAEHPTLRVTWVVCSATGPRGDEARQGAERLLTGAAHADVHVLDLPDGYLPDRWADCKRALARIVADVDAALVFAPGREDRHQDHRVVGNLAWQIFRHAAIWAYEIPKYEGDLSQPNLYVPLDDAVVAEKLALLGTAFPSQRDKPWFDDEAFRGLLRLRGIECGARWAEAFTAEKVVVA